MMLKTQKRIAADVLKCSPKKLVFDTERLSEIKEAITKQDMRDLKNEGAIIIKDIKGGKKNAKKRARRGQGRIKKRVVERKKEYINITRMLRNYVAILKRDGKISKEDFYDIRKKIRNKIFKSRANLKDYIKTSKNK